MSECSKLAQTVNWHRQKINEGTIIWQSIFSGNFVVNMDWKELVAGMNRSLRESWKVKTSNYCISEL